MEAMRVQVLQGWIGGHEKAEAKWDKVVICAWSRLCLLARVEIGLGLGGDHFP